MRDVDRQLEQDSPVVSAAARVVGGSPSPVLFAAGNQAVARMADAQPRVFAQLSGLGSLLGPAGVVADAVTGFVAGEQLSGSVGVKGDNDPGDVAIVMRMLLVAGYGDLDIGAGITRFQEEVVKLPKPDGRVDVEGRTFKALKRLQPKSDGKTKHRSWDDMGTESTPAPTSEAPAQAPRAPAPAPKAADPEANKSNHWPSALPTSKRDQAGGTAITRNLGENHNTVPDMATVELTPAQKALVEEIKKYRETLREEKGLREVTNKAGYKGMMYSGDQSKDVTPEQLDQAPESKATKINKIIYAELGTEGSIDSINTYDNQILTWGKGFSGKGMLNQVLTELYKIDPEARNLMLRAGIDYDPKEGWRVVDTDTGVVETKENALRLMRFDEKLLTVFVDLGKSAEHRQHAANAQWTVVEKNAGNVPEYAYDWDQWALRLCAHLAHWLPLYGWQLKPRYDQTNGDLVKIASNFAYHGRHANAVVVPLPNGAWSGRPLMEYLRVFAKGKGAAAVAEKEVVTATREEASNDPKYKGHLLFPKAEGQYYDVGLLGAV